MEPGAKARTRAHDTSPGPPIARLKLQMWSLLHPVTRSPLHHLQDNWIAAVLDLWIMHDLAAQQTELVSHRHRRFLEERRSHLNGHSTHSAEHHRSILHLKMKTPSK